MSLQNQFVTVAVMIGCGAALGTVFDAYRVLAARLHILRRAIPLFDLVYWIAAALFVFWALYASNYGHVRLYVFLGLFCGVWIYYLIMSRWTVRAVLLAIRAIEALIRFARLAFDRLIVRPAVALYRLFVFLIGILVAFSVFLYKVVVKLLYPLWKLVLWIVRPLKRTVRFAVPGWAAKIYLAIKQAVKKLF